MEPGIISCGEKTTASASDGNDDEDDENGCGSNEVVVGQERGLEDGQVKSDNMDVQQRLIETGTSKLPSKLY